MDDELLFKDRHEKLYSVKTEMIIHIIVVGIILLVGILSNLGMGVVYPFSVVGIFFVVFYAGGVMIFRKQHAESQIIGLNYFLKKLSIPLLFVLILFWYVGPVYTFLHELFHAAAAVVVGWQIVEFNVFIEFNFPCLTSHGYVSYPYSDVTSNIWAMLFVSLAGPAFPYFLYIILLLKAPYKVIKYFSLVGLWVNNQSLNVQFLGFCEQTDFSNIYSRMIHYYGMPSTPVYLLLVVGSLLNGVILFWSHYHVIKKEYHKLQDKKDSEILYYTTQM